MYIQYSKSTVKGKIYSYPLLCNKYRENGKIKTKVIANLSKFPAELVLTMENVLKRGKDALVYLNDIIITKSIDYGFAYVLLVMMKRLRISEVLEKVLGEDTKYVKLMIIGKIITRGSKLSIFNWIQRNEAIGKQLNIDLKTLDLDKIYSVLGDLTNVQNRIENKWHMYHKKECKQVYLYDITSSYFEGTQNALARLGYNRDKKQGKLQIVIGLITNEEGFPLKIEVFEGNTPDAVTVVEQLQYIKNEYQAENIIFVGDRGMRIRYNLNQMNEEEKAGIGYITAMNIEEIRCLLKQEVLQLNMFSKDLAEIEDKEAGERYVLCNNPKLEKEHASKRDSLRNKFEEELHLIQLSYQNRQNKNKTNKEKLAQGHKNTRLVTEFNEKQIDGYKYRIRKGLEKYHMQSFYQIQVDKDVFTIEFLFEEYAQAKALDGKYVIITNIEKERMPKEEVRNQYKNLQHVEHAFRDLKTAQLEVRPIFHINEDTTRGHVLVAMFAYAIIMEIEKKVFPWLKLNNKSKNEQLSFRDIEEELKMIKLNVLKINENYEEIKITELTNRQQEIFDLLKIDRNELMECSN